MAHKVGDLVYSNSFGLGWIERIGKEPDDIGIFQKFPVGETVYTVNFEYSERLPEYYSYPREYNEKGIETMKMFLRMKERGEDV